MFISYLLDTSVTKAELACVKDLPLLSVRLQWPRLIVVITSPTRGENKQKAQLKSLGPVEFLLKEF
jgi:hypothetical protein